MVMEIKCHGLESSLRFSKPDCEGWMNTTVDLVVPSFEGSFICAVEIGEFKAFVEALSELMKSIGKKFEVTWGNMEANIELSFNLQRHGTLSGSYKFSPNNINTGPTLSGGFEADQTFIESWLKQAKEVVANAS